MVDEYAKSMARAREGHHQAIHHYWCGRCRQICKDFWNIVNNQEKVNVNLLKDEDVEIPSHLECLERETLAEAGTDRAARTDAGEAGAVD